LLFTGVAKLSHIDHMLLRADSFGAVVERHTLCRLRFSVHFVEERRGQPIPDSDTPVSPPRQIDKRHAHERQGFRGTALSLSLAGPTAVNEKYNRFGDAFGDGFGDGKLSRTHKNKNKLEQNHAHGEIRQALEGHPRWTRLSSDVSARSIGGDLQAA
jgi:hypothetical protein